MALSSPSFWDDADVIFAYSRADAIRDGVLIEIPEDLVHEAGVSVPVAVTRAVWEGYVSPHDLDELPGQSVNGRMWDLLWMLRWSAVRSHHTNLIQFEVDFVIMQEVSERSELVLVREPVQQTVLLKAVCGPGDEGEPVITIMLPEED